MDKYDIKIVVFNTFLELAFKKDINTAKKLNSYFKIKNGSKLLKGEHWLYDTNKYTNMTAKLIIDSLDKTPKGD